MCRERLLESILFTRLFRSPISVSKTGMKMSRIAWIPRFGRPAWQYKVGEELRNFCPQRWLNRAFFLVAFCVSIYGEASIYLLHHDSSPIAECHDTWENSLIIIFLWLLGAILTQQSWARRQTKTKILPSLSLFALFFLLHLISRWFSMIHMNIICDEFSM